MIKNRYLLRLFLTIMLVLALFSGCSSDRAGKLCEAIETGDNQKAVQIAEKMGSLDVQSTAMPGLVSSFEGEVTTPLVKACETGNKEMIVWLLDHGASADYAPGNILYPLETFCESGSGAGLEAMQKLLDCGADPEKYKGIQPVFRLAGTMEQGNSAGRDRHGHHAAAKRSGMDK